MHPQDTSRALLTLQMVQFLCTRNILGKALRLTFYIIDNFVYSTGTCLLAGGNSKYVCIYEISQQILLKKFQISFNRSLDGVLDEVSILRKSW